MDDELKDILSNLNKEIEQDKLLQYLNRELSHEDQHALEKQMNDDEFMNDAVEGLQQVDKKNIPSLVSELNFNLKKQLHQKKKRRAGKFVVDLPWIYLTIIILLVLLVIAFVVIKRIL